MAQNLLWGYYRGGRLQTAFALKEDGSVLDEKGEAVSHEFFADETGRIGLVHPEELPMRFVSTALAAFRAIIGKSEKRE